MIFSPVNEIRKHRKTNVGASLLAKAVCQSPLMLNVTTSSRASRIAAPPLPHLIGVNLQIYARVAPRALAANWSAGSTCLRSSRR
ncbi:hypothetical protein CUN63_26700 [Pseudomonas sp. ACM7]|nr:hypothetical protein CUN63_26700 [Pseudomonas sp. ACM7]